MMLFLGIDGGQSSTTALIGEDDGRVIGWARGGPCNHVSAAEAAQKFHAVVSSVVRDALTSAGITGASAGFAAACCGMSGGPKDKTALLRTIINTERLHVVTDGEIALNGAMGGGPGVIVIAGTGSIAFGGNGAKIVRAGGWGYIFGDEGGAFDIARQAVRAALRFEEGWGTPTQLHRALLDVTEANTANEMLHLFYTSEWPRSRVAALSALVDSVAIDGDAVASGILEQSAQQLASLAGSVRRQVFDEGEGVAIAPIGGVFRSRILKRRFEMLVELTDGGCVEPLYNPAAGALLQAYRDAGFSVKLSNVPQLK